jgi:long-chain acyl-CoA synthetase
MTGYYKDDKATREVFTGDGFLHTGDLGEIDKMGRLKITGRAKELFKTSGGKYVAPAPIENLINNHKLVEASCVAGSGFSQPFGILMLGEEARFELENGGKMRIESELADHINFINNSLAHHEQLAFLAVTRDEWLPENGFLTPTMKIKRIKLEKTYCPMAESWFAEKKPVVWQA